MIELVVDNVYTWVRGDFSKWKLDRLLSFYVEGFQFAPIYRFCPNKCRSAVDPTKAAGFDAMGCCKKCKRHRIWDGKKHLLAGMKDIPYFPTGCLEMVKNFIQKETGTEPTIVDSRKALSVLPAVSELIDPKDANTTRKLWDRQIGAVSAALNAMRGVIQSPTGSGKTSILAAITKSVPGNAAILINNTTIAAQLQREISALTGENVGIIQADKFDVQRITVATVQTLAARLKIAKVKNAVKDPRVNEWIGTVNTLLLDEAHHGSSRTWYDVANKFRAAYCRIGVTGTAMMRGGQDMMLIGATGELIYEVPESELIESGTLARPIVEFHSITEPRGLVGDDYDEVYKLGVVENDQLNEDIAATVKKENENGKKVLVLAERLEHISRIFKLIAPPGVPAEDWKDGAVLTGESEEEKRVEAIDAFSKDLNLIIASKIFDEGVDMPEVDVVILSGLGKSKIKIKQRVGRGQRKKKGDDNTIKIIAYDHKTHRFLRAHSAAHRKFFKALGYEIRDEKNLFS